jgi:hypothetical protein
MSQADNVVPLRDPPVNRPRPGDPAAYEVEVRDHRHERLVPKRVFLDLRSALEWITAEFITQVDPGCPIPFTMEVDQDGRVGDMYLGWPGDGDTADGLVRWLDPRANEIHITPVRTAQAIAI